MVYRQNFRALPTIAILCVTAVMFRCASVRTADAKPEAAKGDSSQSSDWTGRVVLITISGNQGIFWDRSSLVRKKVEKIFARIKREPPRLVVIEIDSPGGSVSTCDDLSKMIKECNVHTVALVTHKAVSGGAVIATACNEIVMVRGSRIGDVKPIMMLPGPVGKPAEIPEGIREKVERDVITLLESNAEANHHPVNLLKAMVSPQVELYEIKLSDNKREFLSRKEVEVLEDNIAKGRDQRKITDKQIVSEQGRLLELTAQKALDYGLASKVEDSRDAFFQDRGANEDNMIIAQVSDKDVSISSLFSSLAGGKALKPVTLFLVGLFLALGIAGVVTEMHMPGFGIPGAIGIIGFAGFFTILVLHGNAEWYEIGLFLLGIILLVVEIVVIPGFGVPGVVGIICIMAGLFMSVTPSFGTPYMHKFFWDEFSRFVFMMGAVSVGVCLVVYFTITHGSKLPFLHGMYLDTSLRPGTEVLADVRNDTETPMDQKRDELLKLIGKTGTASSPLRPAGKIRLDSGELVDVVTQGDLIAAGEKVKVLEVKDNRIVVGKA